MTGTGSRPDPFLWGRRAALGLVVVVYLYVIMVFVAIVGTGTSLEAKLFGVSALIVGVALPAWVWHSSPLVRSLW